MVSFTVVIQVFVFCVFVVVVIVVVFKSTSDNQGRAASEKVWGNDEDYFSGFRNLNLSVLLLVFTSVNSVKFRLADSLLY